MELDQLIILVQHNFLIVCGWRYL